MNPKKRILSLLVVGASLSIGFVGCGGGGGGSSAPTTAVTKTGTFVDSPVEGLSYKTATLSGFTDNQGRFQYKDGETVTFKIGNLVIGSVIGANQITPLTLNGENDLNNISIKAAGLARLLQTLDNNTSGGAILFIPLVLKDLNISGLNLDADADLNTILARAQVKTGINYILKDSASAKAAMKVQIEATNTYPLISSMNYSASGTKYYMLRLLHESNVDLSHSGTNSFEVGMALGGTNLITIYNLHLNNITRHNGKLYAGTYIIKVRHDTSTNSTFTINYPTLLDQTTHTKLKNGTFSNSGVHYYSLHMPSSGQVDFSYNSGLAGSTYPAYISDTNLSLLNHLSGIMSLNAGDYVIYFDHGATDRTPNPLTITSIVLP